MVNYWKVILATMVIFGAGVVTGGLLVRQTQRTRAYYPGLNPAINRPATTVTAGGLRLDFLRRMERELNLSAEQRERVDLILRESQERTRNLMEPVQPRIRAEIQRTKEEFRAALRPDQRARFEELLRLQQQQPQRPRDSRTPGTNVPRERDRTRDRSEGNYRSESVPR